MKFTIARRWWSSLPAIEVEIDASLDAAPHGVKLGAAIKVALQTGADLTRADLTRAVLTDADLTRAVLTDADLTGADLTDADLTRAVLTDADLTRADLTRAVLTDADLTGADLTRADLTRAVLTGADLTRADLTRAVLTGADLTDADLTRAVLTDADLTRADLTRAVLTDADLRSFKADLWMTLTQNRAEVPGLVAALREGRVDGSTYSGECACLVGTIANVKRVNFEDLDRNPANPAERWFAMIRQGDKPGDETAGGFAAAKALEWAIEWCALNGLDDGPATVAAPDPTVSP